MDQQDGTPNAGCESRELIARLTASDVDHAHEVLGIGREPRELLSFGVGAAGVLTSVVLFMLAPDKPATSASTSPTVQPLVGFQSVGVAGTF